MLTAEQIRTLLDLLAQETVVEPTDAFPFRVSRRAHGYSRDPKIGALQAKLSIMLEVKGRLADGNEE